MDSVHGSWTSAGVARPRVHRGLPPSPTARARWSLDDGEEAAHRRRSFGSGASSTREWRRARESLRARGGGAGVTGGP
jgi:hypothetical protein